MSDTLGKIAAVMGIVNAIQAQPEGLTEPSLWAQTEANHGELTETEFRHVLAEGVKQGALEQNGERYKFTAVFAELNGQR